MWIENKIFFGIMCADLKRYFRSLSDLSLAPVFYLMMVGIFSIALPFNAEQLRSVGPVILWIAAILAILFSLDFQFRKDQQEGGIELLVLSVHPLPGLLSAKVLALLIAVVLPIIALSPILGYVFQFSLQSEWVLVLSFILGLPGLLWFIFLGLALTIGLQKGGVLLSILVLPLIMPMVLLGISAVNASVIGISFGPALALLAAISILSWMILPQIVSLALKVSQE